MSEKPATDPENGKGKPTDEQKGKISQLAKDLGVSRVQVWRLAQKGMPLDSADAARAWRAENVRSKTGEGRVVNETRRLRSAQADLVELEAAEKAGKLAPVEDYAQATMEAMTIIGTRLSGFPSRVAGTLAGMNDPAQIRRYLTDELNSIRADAADALEDWAKTGMAPRGEAPAAEALPPAERVGGHGEIAPAG